MKNMHHKSIFLSASIFLLAFTLFACSESKETATPANKELLAFQAASESVDASEIYAEPQKYEGRRTKIYLNNVVANFIFDESQTEWGRIIISTDKRIPESPRLFLLLPKKVAPKWDGMQFIAGKKYTITLIGEVKKAYKSARQEDIFGYFIEDFLVNWENVTAPIKNSNFFENGFPNEVQASPMPVVITDPQRMAIFHSEYIGKNVRLNIEFRKRYLKSQPGGGAKIDFEFYSITIDENYLKKVFDILDDGASIWVTGVFGFEGGTSSKPVIRVTNIQPENYGN